MRGHRGRFAHHDGFTEQGMNSKRNSYITNFMPPSLHHEVARVRLPRLCQAEGCVNPAHVTTGPQTVDRQTTAQLLLMFLWTEPPAVSLPFYSMIFFQHNVLYFITGFPLIFTDNISEP